MVAFRALDRQANLARGRPETPATRHARPDDGAARIRDLSACRTVVNVIVDTNTIHLTGDPILSPELPAAPDPLRAAITAAWVRDEAEHVRELLAAARQPDADRKSDEIRQSKVDARTANHPTYLLDVDNALVVPTNTKIRFLITADDVIHSWWVPALGWKQDAIPGLINEGWTEIKTPGLYRGQCAELCGKDHGFMPIVVKAVPKAEFDQWLAAERAKNAPPAPAEPAEAAPPVEAAPAAEAAAPATAAADQNAPEAAANAAG